MFPLCLLPSIDRSENSPNPMQFTKNIATRVAWSECERMLSILGTKRCEGIKCQIVLLA